MLYDKISVTVNIDINAGKALYEIKRSLDFYGAKLIASTEIKNLTQKTFDIKDEFRVYKIEKPLVQNNIYYVVTLHSVGTDFILSIADNPEEAISYAFALVVKLSIYVDDKVVKVDHDKLKDIVNAFCKMRDEVLQKLNAQNTNQTS